jgi:glycerophosphoryl diester phosphodiesterase
LGYGTFLLLFLPFGIWIFNKNIFARAGLLVLLSVLLNAYLKDFYQDPRPDVMFHLDPAVGRSWGFPSGHAQIAIVLWMWIACEVRQKWTWILCPIITIGICLSRLYLGVHDVEDVLGGLLIGAVTLLVFAYLMSDRHKLRRNLHPVVQLLIIAILQLTLFLTWPGKGPGAVYGYGVFLFGFWIGVLIEKKKIHYQKASSVLRLVLAGILGVAGLMLLRKGLGAAFNAIAPNNAILGLLLALILGLYMTAIGPWVLIKTRLADQETSD